MRDFHRFFLSGCPEEGPAREQELDVVLQDVSLAEHLERLRTAAGSATVRTLVEVPHEGRAWPILHVHRSAPAGGPRLLIVAGMHGNEVAGALAGPDILEDARTGTEAYERVDLHLVAPANPIGLAKGSRYNADGCDINRDFEDFDTAESRAIRDLVETVDPDLILSLHEGPHPGFFLIATRSTPPALARAVAEALKAHDVELATESHLGSALDPPGVMQEGWLLTAAKTLLAIESLGAYAHARSIPLLTTEGPWSDSDIGARVRAQVLAVRAAAAALHGLDLVRDDGVHGANAMPVRSRSRRSAARSTWSSW